TTGGTSCPRTNGCCSDTTSRLLPAPARRGGRGTRRNSARRRAACVLLCGAGERRGRLDAGKYWAEDRPEPRADIAADQCPRNARCRRFISHHLPVRAASERLVAAVRAAEQQHLLRFAARAPARPHSLHDALPISTTGAPSCPRTTASCSDTSSRLWPAPDP